MSVLQIEVEKLMSYFFSTIVCLRHRTQETCTVEKMASSKKAVNSYCCCPSSDLTHPHTLMPHFDESDVSSEKPRHKKPSKKSSLSSHVSCGANNSMPCATNSLGGSSLSDSSSSSTTATTVAYYAAIPLLIDQNSSGSPPPPLPNSQPPTFSPSFSIHSKSNGSSPDYNFHVGAVYQVKPTLERTVSTPSMAYYKIVDCDLVECDQNQSNALKNSKKLDFGGIDDTTPTYYQLSPTQTRK